MNNAKKIEQIKKWQTSKYLHPLTCIRDSLHKLPEPVIENDKVVLRCPTCFHIQLVIPKQVYEVKWTDNPFGKIEKMIEKLEKRVKDLEERSIYSGRTYR